MMIGATINLYTYEYAKKRGQTNKERRNIISLISAADKIKTNYTLHRPADVHKVRPSSRSARFFADQKFLTTALLIEINIISTKRGN
jgi:hypothetical protein